jgi:hypothetical protein
MDTERDEYDVFLDTWKPSELLEHATLASNVHDPLVQSRLLEDSTGAASLIRTAFVGGPKFMTEAEEQARKFRFFEQRQQQWSAEFRSRLQSEGLEGPKVDQFIRCFAELWVDGRSRRQNSPEMMAVKASIRDHDQVYHGEHAGRFVLTPVSVDVAPLFNAEEMAAVFETNAGLLEAFIPDYLCEVEGERSGSINFLYVRRGVRMPASPGKLREELHYLSSYSLALTPVEQFAQTWDRATKDRGVPCIFSAPLPALQKRVVAFAPFIAAMDLSQLELIVAPPIEPTSLRDVGERGGVHDYEFE